MNIEEVKNKYNEIKAKQNNNPDYILTAEEQTIVFNVTRDPMYASILSEQNVETMAPLQEQTVDLPAPTMQKKMKKTLSLKKDSNGFISITVITVLAVLVGFLMMVIIKSV